MGQLHPSRRGKTSEAVGMEDSWMKVKDDERRGDRECRDALKALEEAKKETVEAVKKTEAFHRLWVDAKRSKDRARARQEQLRLREEGECKALRKKCALARELKAKMENQEARPAMREKEERQKSKRKEEERMPDILCILNSIFF